MATTINLGKVVPEKGVDYFTEQEVQEFKEQATQELQEQITTNKQDITNIKAEQITQNENIEDLDNATESLLNELSITNNKVDSLADDYDTDTAEGTSLHLTNSASAPIKDIKIGDGEIKQDGEPTPSNPIQVKVVEGGTEVIVSDKNLFDKNDESKILNGYLTGGVFQKTDSNIYKTLYIPCVEGKKYTVSKIKSERFIIGTFASVPVNGLNCIDTLSNKDATSITIESGVGAKYLAVYYYLGGTDTLTEEEIRNSIQIEESDKTSEYIEHQGQTYPLTLPSGMFLGRIGTSSNYIHGKKNNWKLHKALGVFDNMTLLTSNGISNDRIGLLTPELNIEADMSGTSFASVIKCNSLPTTIENNSGLGGTTSASKIRIYLSTQYASTYEEAKTFLANANTKIYYPLATVTDETITDETLISQLNAISDMQTYKDETIIYSLTQNLNPTLKIAYRKKEDDSELIEQINEVQAQVTRLRSNFDRNTPTPSGNLTITDAINDIVDLYTPIGKTSQVSYTGKNILPNQNTQAVTMKGVTITPNEDGSLTLTGTSTDNIYYFLQGGASDFNYTLQQDSYILTGGISANIFMRLVDSNNTIYDNTTSPRTITLEEETHFYCALRIANNTATNTTIYPMIRKANIADATYEPYVGGQASPSPDFPQPIENVTGDVITETSNKNLFKLNRTAIGGSGNLDYEWLSNGVRISLKSGSTSDFGYLVFDLGEIKNFYNKNVTLQMHHTNGNSSAFLNCSADGTNRTTIGNSIGANNSITTTIGDNYSQPRLAVRLYISSAVVGTNYDFTDIQVEIGSTATSYVEHQGQSITFPLAEGQKLMQGDYLAEDGIHNVRGQVILNGSENWGDPNSGGDSTGTSLRFELKRSNSNIVPSATQAGFSNYFIASGSTYGNTATRLQYNTTSIFIRINLAELNITTAEELKTWLASHNTIIQYSLAQEVIEPYTSEQQIAWNNLQKLETYKDCTHIYTSSDGLAPDSKVTYLVNPLSSIEARLDLLEG